MSAGPGCIVFYSVDPILPPTRSRAHQPRRDRVELFQQGLSGAFGFGGLLRGRRRG